MSIASHPRPRWRWLVRLAWRDLWHERALALGAACVLAATVAPLWTLWGLERGVIGTLIERQDRDPLMREIVPEATGTTRFDAAWIAHVRRWPEVAFVLPTVRHAAALVDLVSDGAPAPVTTELRATAPGDPLLAGASSPPEGGVVLSADAARQLAARPGTRLQVPLQRTRQGREERAVLDVSVHDVLPMSASEGVHALAAPGWVQAIEFWRDGYTLPGWGGDGQGPPPADAVPARFRLYAQSIRDVATLAGRLEDEGVSVRTRAREIEGTLGLQRNVRAVLAMVAGVTLGGAAVALLALQAATLRRKRREYALLKLTGHGRAWLLSLPCLNATAVAGLGTLIAAALSLMAAWAINTHFASHLAHHEAAVRLTLPDLLAGAGLAWILSLLPAFWGGWRASNVEAADELRDP